MFSFLFIVRTFFFDKKKNFLFVFRMNTTIGVMISFWQTFISICRNYVVTIFGVKNKFLVEALQKHVCYCWLD